MSTTTRKGGCGCGGKTHTHNGGSNGNGGCGCRSAQPCGCQDHGPRVVLGDCNCEGPVRCGVPCLERPAYSAGQLLTADSLRLGQRYFEEKFALRRYVDGVGVVCGLHVRCDPEEPGWVVVDPGYAIDCCGNDIVLCEPVRFNVCKAIAACPKPEEPCEDVVAEVPEPAPGKVETGPLNLGDVKPTARQATHAQLTGYVLDGDAAVRTPLVGATVVIEGTNHRVMTDTSGRYSFYNPNSMLPTGVRKVTASYPQFRDGYRNVEISSSFVNEADFALKRPAAASVSQPAPGPDLGKLATEFLDNRAADETAALRRLAEQLAIHYQKLLEDGNVAYATAELQRWLAAISGFWTQQGLSAQQARDIAERIREIAIKTPPKPPVDPVDVSFHTYVLRIERTWEGRAPTAVVVSRAGCDPRPESRPSKEVGSVRLCVSKLEEIPTGVRMRDRTKEFRQVGLQLLQRVARAIELAGGITPDPEKDPNPRGRLIADALLTMLREEPAHSSCNLYDLICDIRRLITNGTPQCFGFPQSVLDNHELALVGVFGQLIDDFRELYLTRGCDDCCEHVGIRVAHVITQDQLPACAPRGCSIAAIDTHAPAREALHPRSGWYFPHQVPVYDAYFLGYAEAGVLLTARGLTVQGLPTTSHSDQPSGFETVWDWVEEIAEDELGRFDLYQSSLLYVDFGSSITLWLVEGRVVAITAEGRDPFMSNKYRTSSRISYLKYSISPRTGEDRDFLIDTVEPTGRDVSIPMREERVVAEQPKAAERPRAGEPTTAATPETMRILTALDPVPFRDLIWGIGAKTESAFYLRGITTLEKLVETPDMELAEMIRIGEIEYVKAQAKDILSGKISFAPDELMQWGAAARLRKAKIERSIA